MRTETYTRYIYEYDELSDEAKKEVKDRIARWRSEDSDTFPLYCEDRLDYEFPHSDLKIQHDLSYTYDLSYTKKIGVNIYGDLYLLDVVPHINLSSDEKALLKYAFDNFGDSYNMKRNNPYCYCICNQQNYIYEILDNIAYDKDIVVEEVNQLGFTTKQLSFALDKFNKETKEYFTNLCSDFAEYGHEFFYLTDEEASEICCNKNWEFYEDGTLYEKIYPF